VKIEKELEFGEKKDTKNFRKISDIKFFFFKKFPIRPMNIGYQKKNNQTRKSLHHHLIIIIIMPPKRAFKSRKPPVKRVASSSADEYFLDRITPVPIVNPVLWQQYNDPRSWLSELPANLICYEIDSLLPNPKQPAGSVPPDGGSYKAVSSYKYEWVPPPPSSLRGTFRHAPPPASSSTDKARFPPSCRLGINGEIVILLPDMDRIVVLGPDGQSVHSTFVMYLPGGESFHDARCAAVYKNGDIAVSGSMGAKNIHVFSATGIYLRFIDNPRVSTAADAMFGALFANLPDLQIAIDDKDNLYVCGTNLVYVYAARSTVMTRRIEINQVDFSLGFSVFNDRLYIALASYVMLVDLPTGEITTTPVMRHGQLWKPIVNRMDVDGSGNVLINYSFSSSMTVAHSSRLTDLHVLGSDYELECTSRSPIMLAVIGMNSMCIDTRGDIWVTSTKDTDFTVKRFASSTNGL